MGPEGMPKYMTVRLIKTWWVTLPILFLTCKLRMHRQGVTWSGFSLHIDFSLSAFGLAISPSFSVDPGIRMSLGSASYADEIRSTGNGMEVHDSLRGRWHQIAEWADYRTLLKRYDWLQASRCQELKTRACISLASLKREEDVQLVNIVKANESMTELCWWIVSLVGSADWIPSNGLASPVFRFLPLPSRLPMYRVWQCSS